jgi:hypothetical protein
MAKFSSRVLSCIAVLLLAGCTTDKAGNCPAVTSLVETAVATVFRQEGVADPSNILYTVEITGMTSSCDVDKLADNANTNIDISFRATRAPDGAAAHYKVPYFVAITQSDRIVAKKIYTVEFDFAPGAATASFTDSIGSAQIEVAKDKKTFDYNILVGLQLTRAQLAYNRATGRYQP